MVYSIFRDSLFVWWIRTTTLFYLKLLAFRIKTLTFYKFKFRVCIKATSFFQNTWFGWLWISPLRIVIHVLQNSDAGELGTHWGETNKASYHFTWPGRLPFNQNFRKFGNSGNGREISGKVSRNSGNCWISEMWTIQPKILEILGAKLNGKETSGKRHFRKFGYTSRGFPLVWKFWKILFHSLLQVAKN